MASPTTADPAPWENYLSEERELERRGSSASPLMLLPVPSEATGPAEAASSEASTGAAWLMIRGPLQLCAHTEEASIATPGHPVPEASPSAPPHTETKAQGWGLTPRAAHQLQLGGRNL